jgi:hypothetical protein
LSNIDISAFQKQTRLMNQRIVSNQVVRIENTKQRIFEVRLTVTQDVRVSSLT